MKAKRASVGVVWAVVIAASIGAFGDPVYAGGEIRIAISAEQEKPLGTPAEFPIQLKVDVTCQKGFDGGCNGSATAKGTIECEVRPFSARQHKITCVNRADPETGSITFYSGTINGQDCAGGTAEAEWNFGVAKGSQTVIGRQNGHTVCDEAGVPPDRPVIFLGEKDTIKSEVQSKPN